MVKLSASEPNGRSGGVCALEFILHNAFRREAINKARSHVESTLRWNGPCDLDHLVRTAAYAALLDPADIVDVVSEFAEPGFDRKKALRLARRYQFDLFYRHKRLRYHPWCDWELKIEFEPEARS